MSHPLVITGSSLPLNSAITKPSPASCFLEVLLPSGTSTNSLCMGQNFLTVDEDSPLSTLSIHSLRTFGEIKGIRSIFLYHITKVPNSCHSQKDVPVTIMHHCIRKPLYSHVSGNNSCGRHLLLRSSLIVVEAVWFQSQEEGAGVAWVWSACSAKP